MRGRKTGKERRIKRRRMRGWKRKRGRREYLLPGIDAALDEGM